MSHSGTTSQIGVAASSGVSDPQFVNEYTIDDYKNLKYSLSDYKRVHIDKSFVLIFKVYRKEKHILFERFDHHDRIYRN